MFCKETFHQVRKALVFFVDFVAKKRPISMKGAFNFLQISHRRCKKIDFYDQLYVVFIQLYIK